MVCNILFTQVQDAKIELIECEAFLIDQEDHVKKADYYSVQFGVTTFNEVYESTKSTTHHFERQKPKANSLQALTSQKDKKLLKWCYIEDPAVNEFEITLDYKLSIGAPHVNFLMSMIRIKDASLQLKISEEIFAHKTVKIQKCKQSISPQKPKLTHQKPVLTAYNLFTKQGRLLLNNKGKVFNQNQTSRPLACRMESKKMDESS